MAFTYRKRIPILGRLLGLNVSKRGVTSVTSRIGPFTINSRGSWSLDLPGPWSYRGRWAKPRPAKPTEGNPRIKGTDR